MYELYAVIQNWLLALYEDLLLKELSTNEHTYTHVHVVVAVHSQDSMRREACMCECCPGCALQLCCWKYLSKK